MYLYILDQASASSCEATAAARAKNLPVGDEVPANRNIHALLVNVIYNLRIQLLRGNM